MHKDVETATQSVIDDALARVEAENEFRNLTLDAVVQQAGILVSPEALFRIRRKKAQLRDREVIALEEIAFAGAHRRG